MNKEVKKRWIEALRSGEYKQGKGFLHQADGSMCCLGVLCDIELDEYWTPAYIDHEYYSILGSSGLLPNQFSEKVGLYNNEEHKLSNMNDSNRSFEEIADYIEGHL